MEKSFQRRLAFICRSMVWSALLYMAIMLAFNWDEVNNTLHGRHEMTVVTNLLSENNNENNSTRRNISGRASIIATAASVIKVITGLAAHPDR